MQRDSRIYVAGHTGLVGSGLVRALAAQGYTNVLGRTRRELDLTDAAAVDAFFERARPEYVILAAAKVGGIMANDTYPADFIRDNLAIQLNVITAAHRAGVTKLLFLGSACVYPKVTPQPIKEEYLLTGPLEPTNAPYAIAKIAGISMCESYNRQYGTNYITAMPTNLYGPEDRFDLQNAHVLPALLRRFHEAKRAGAPRVTLWGTGRARREFLHVDDMAAACLELLRRHDSSAIVNIGCGDDIAIGEAALLVRDVVGYEGAIAFDRSKPDGTPVRRLDSSRMQALGWRPRIGLEDGLRSTYAWYQAHEAEVLARGGY